MKIVGCDLHTRYQQIAMLEEETGELVSSSDVLVEAREKVGKLKKQGRTLEEVITAKPTAPYDAEWGQSFQSPKSFLGWVYQGV